jgi:hypothetical protein
VPPVEPNPDEPPTSHGNPTDQPDLMSIGAGIVFFLIGGAYLLASGGHVDVNAGWTVSLLLTGLGLSGVGGALQRARRRRRPDR